MRKTIFHTLKLSNTLNLIETAVKKTKHTEKKAKKKAIKILNKKKTKLKPVVESDDEQEDFSDAETIQYAEPYRDSSKKGEIYRRKNKKKAIRTLTKKGLSRKNEDVKIPSLNLLHTREQETVERKSSCSCKFCTSSTVKFRNN